MEYNEIINLEKNKDFAEACFNILKNIKLQDVDIEMLLDANKITEVTNSRYSFTYSILKEVPIIEDVSKEMRMENGNLRYYPKKYSLNGRAYLICNDWYYPTSGKKNVKDNRTPFLKWLFKISERN